MLENAAQAMSRYMVGFMMVICGLIFPDCLGMQTS